MKAETNKHNMLDSHLHTLFMSDGLILGHIRRPGKLYIYNIYNTHLHLNSETLI